MKTLNTPKPIENLDAFKSLGGRELYLIKFIKPNTLEYWYDATDRQRNPLDTIKQGLIKVTEVSQVALTNLSVWEQLSKKVQQEVTEAEEAYRNAPKDRMKHARSKRRNKYEGIPREVTCSKCNKKQAIQPAQILKRAENADMAWQDWVEKFRCQGCFKSPRGRKANPKYAGLPTELVCSCGKTIKTTPYYLVNISEKRGVTVDEFVADFHCQGCRPSKRGRKKKGDKKNK